MENAADALKMAGAVLIFVLAISVIIFSFGQARRTSDTILEYKDRETTYEYYDYDIGQLNRTVGLETVIPAIYRAYLENYRIVFEGLDEPIYCLKNSTGEIRKFSLDLESNDNNDNLQFQNVRLANADEKKKEFLKGILYHEYNYNVNSFMKTFEISSMPGKSLYKQLYDAINSGKKIYEYLGVYYQDDSENTPDVNKTEKRIITYKIKY